MLFTQVGTAAVTLPSCKKNLRTFCNTTTQRSVCLDKQLTNSFKISLIFLVTYLQQHIKMTDIITVDKWDAGQVKNVLDETAKQVVLQHFKYDESNTLVDIRLFLCGLPVAAAFFALIYDFLHPFPESAGVIKICVYAYIVLIVILTLYSTFVENNTILIAYKKGKNRIKVKLVSKMKRFDDQYTLILEGPKNKTSWTKSVGNYFDVNGVFVQDKFEKDVVKLHKGTKNN